MIYVDKEHRGDAVMSKPLPSIVGRADVSIKAVLIALWGVVVFIQQLPKLKSYYKTNS